MPRIPWARQVCVDSAWISQTFLVSRLILLALLFSQACYLFIGLGSVAVLSLEEGEEAGEGGGLLPLLDGEHQGVVLVPLGRVRREVVLE